MTGKELDPDFIGANSVNRRYHFPARFYLPFRGVFAQIDSLASFKWIVERYVYGSHNPTMNVDADGNEATSQFRKRCPVKFGGSGLEPEFKWWNSAYYTYYYYYFVGPVYCSGTGWDNTVIDSGPCPEPCDKDSLRDARQRAGKKARDKANAQCKSINKKYTICKIDSIIIINQGCLPDQNLMDCQYFAGVTVRGVCQ